MKSANNGPAAWAVEKKITAAFLMALVLLAAMGVASYCQHLQAEENSQWVAHTHEVLTVLDEIEANLESAESGQRAYLLTGDRTVLDSCQTAVWELREKARPLRSLIADNPRQHQRVETLDLLIEQRLALLAAALDTQAPPALDAGAQKVRTVKEKQITYEITHIIKDMRAEENRLLQLRLAHSVASARTTRLLLASAGLLVMALFMTAVLLVNRNINRRLRLEKELRLSEERYRMLFETANDAILVTDDQARYLDANRQAELLTGYTREELLRLHIMDLIPEGIRERGSALFQDFKRQGCIAGAYTIVQKSGSTIPVEFTANRISEGRYQAILRDISERNKVEETMRRAHEELEARVQERTADLAKANMALRKNMVDQKLIQEVLRASENRYRHIVETGLEGIWIIDAESKITFSNQRMAAMLGYDVGEMMDRELFMFVDGAAREVAEASIECCRRGISEQRDFTFRRKDGTDLYTIMSAAPLVNNDRQYTGALWMVTDITQRMRLEEQLHQAQKMEAVGQLAGGVAHDFNNLLTIINGYSEMLLVKCGQGDPARVSLEEIRKAGERAEGLTRQLLAFSFSRLQVLQPRVLDLNVVVAEAEKMLRRLIGEDIDLVVVRDPALGRVKADPGQIDQILMNLAVNARDAMPQGGQITIETRNVELDETFAQAHFEVRPGPYVLLAVSDTGIGMDDQTKARIFEPFFTTKERGKGTGLGLATVYGIVKQCAGNIGLYSEPGQGATFKIYLPRVHGEGKRPEAEPARAASPGGTETVLLVEDEEPVRILVREILQSKGYAVLEAGHGAEALRVAEQHAGPIQLLMTDVVMPGMSGRQLAAALVNSRRGMKVLYLSGYTDDAVVHHGALEKETAFLQKPFTPETLARKVREVLEQNPPRLHYHGRASGQDLRELPGTEV